MRALLLATAAFLLPLAVGAAEPQYHIRFKEPALGTRVIKNMFTLNVPPEKNYSELTEAEKNRVKANFDAMPAADEPPYPVGGVRALYTVISEVQHYWKTEGELEMVASVKADGTVSNVSVYKTPPRWEMAPYVAQILAVQKFKPAICDGVPCAMDFPLKLNLVKKEKSD